MATNITTRKPLRKLTRADLQAFPVWDWAINEEGAEGLDESTVRPTTHAAIPVDGAAQFIVSATARLRDNTTMPALVEVTVSGKQRRFAPLVVLLFDRHLDFTGVETTRVLSQYTNVANNCPVQWQLAVPLVGEKTVRTAMVGRNVILRLLGLVRRPKGERAARGALGSPG